MSIIISLIQYYNNKSDKISKNGGYFHMGYPDLKYRKRYTTSIDKNILAAFLDLAKKKNQPKSWLMDEALLDILKKNGIEVEKANNK